MFEANPFFPERDEAINKALEKATPDQLRSIALAVARFACKRTELIDPVIEQALSELQNGRDV